VIRGPITVANNDRGTSSEDPANRSERDGLNHDPESREQSENKDSNRHENNGEDPANRSERDGMNNDAEPDNNDAGDGGGGDGGGKPRKDPQGPRRRI
jgi:hypothetical protein